MAKLLRGNAARMARRIDEGKPPTAAVLADALAIDQAAAAAWLAAASYAMTEDEITASLVALGSKK
jgi:hypothetical protein